MVQNITNKNIELEIILCLLRGSNHLREIARSIDEPHATVLRKINELLENKVIDFKYQGKNKVFSLLDTLRTKTYLYTAEIYKLQKFLKKHPEFLIIFEDLIKNAPDKMIILFGSYAKGIAKHDSDIDIYIDSNDSKLKERLKEINSRLSLKLGNFDKNSLLIKEIIKNHVIIRGVEDFYENLGFFKEA